MTNYCFNYQIRNSLNKEFFHVPMKLEYLLSYSLQHNAHFILLLLFFFICTNYLSEWVKMSYILHNQ
jgi:hypothetical protein